MKVIIIISKHRRLTQTHLNTRHTHTLTITLVRHARNRHLRKHKTHTQTHLQTDRVKFEGRGVRLGNGFIFVQRERDAAAAVKC